MEDSPSELPCSCPPAGTEEGFSEVEGGRGLLAFPPRTIPFRSASFSQVDVTSEGKYVQRNPSRSPITLKTTAFCLNAPIENPLEESPIGGGGGDGSPTIISHAQSRSCPVELTELLREGVLPSPELGDNCGPGTTSLDVCHGQVREGALNLEQARE